MPSQRFVPSVASGRPRHHSRVYFGGWHLGELEAGDMGQSLKPTTLVSEPITPQLCNVLTAPDIENPVAAQCRLQFPELLI